MSTVLEGHRHHVPNNSKNVSFDLIEKTIVIPPSQDDIRIRDDTPWDVLYYTAAEYRRISVDNQKYIDRMNCTYGQSLYSYDPLPISAPGSDCGNGGRRSSLDSCSRHDVSVDEEGHCFRGLEHMTLRGSRRRKMDIQRAIYAVLEEQDRQRWSSITEPEKELGTINTELLAQVYRGFTAINESDAIRLGRKDEASAKAAYEDVNRKNNSTTTTVDLPLTQALLLLKEGEASSSSKLSFMTSSALSDSKRRSEDTSELDVKEPPPAAQPSPSTATNRRRSSASRSNRPLFGFFQRGSARSTAR